MDSPQELPDLFVGEGGHDFPGRFRYLHPGEGAGLYHLLRDQPGPEGPDGTQITVDAVSGESFLLGFGEAVVAEAPLLLQVEDEGPDLGGPDVRDIGG